MILLVVDSSFETAREVARIFRSDPVRVLPAESSRKARAILDSCDVGVAIVELGLPDGDAIELARLAMEEGHLGAVVFYTRLIDGQLLARASLVGPVLLKGCDVDELRAAVLESATQLQSTKALRVAV